MSEAATVSETVTDIYADIRRTYPMDWRLGLACVGVAIFACLWLIYSAVNYQELFNARLAVAPLSNGIFSLVSPDDPMPLYYGFIYLLSHWFAINITSLRLLSIVCYALSVPLAYVTAWQSTNDRRVGAVAATLLAVSPFAIWYASRGTMYMPLALLVLMNQFVFIRFIQGAVWFWPLYVLSGLLALGLHYFFIVVIAVQLTFALLERQSLARRVYGVILASVLLTSALGWWRWYSGQHTSVWQNLPYTGKPSATNVFIIFAQFLFGFQSVEIITLFISLWPLLVLLGLLAVQKYIGPPLAIRYLTLAAFLPVIVMFALGWVGWPLFISSYLIVCLPAYMIVLGWYLVVFDLKALAVARTVLIVAMAAMLIVELANTQRAVSEDYLGSLPRYQPAASARLSAYAGHQLPAAGPPLQLPSDSPGVLIHR